MKPIGTDSLRVLLIAAAAVAVEGRSSAGTAIAAAQIPLASSVRKRGVPVRFVTKRSGAVSVNVFRSDGVLAHPLAVGVKLPAGEHTIQWDGCDDTGRPVPVGQYTFKGLVSNVRSVWDGKVGNTSPSPGIEHLQYRTGHYSDVIAMPDGGVVTLSMWGERSRIIQYIEGTRGYPVRWASGHCSGWLDYLVAGAADENYVYGVRCRKAKDGKRFEVLKRWSLKDGVRPADADVILNKPHGPNAPPRGSRRLPPGYAEDPHHPVPLAGVCGLAHHRGKLYVPLLFENRVAVYDAATMKEVASLACPSPRRIALNRQGQIFAISGHEVLRLEGDGTRRTALIAGLDTPWGITIASDAKIYVTDCGDSQQLKVFSPAGKLLRTFGRKGGHRGGRVSFDLLDMPLAVSVNGAGHVFIADFGGQRVVILNRDFTLRKIVHGRMPQFALSVSELDRSLVYTTFARLGLWEYKIDYQAKTSTLVRRWNSTRPDAKMLLKGRAALGNGRLYFRKWGGRTFGIQAGCGLVFEMVGDRILPRVKLGRRRWPWQRKPSQGYDKEWVWRDRNLDGVMQNDEYEFGDWPSAWSWMGGYVDDQGHMVLHNQQTHSTVPWHVPGVLRVPFEGLDKNGLPIYRWASAKWVLKATARDKEVGLDGKPYEFEPSTYMQDRAGNFYVSDCGGPDSYWLRQKKAFSIRKYTKGGRLLWKVGRKRRGRLQRPGDMKFCNYESGIVDDRYLFYVDYEGPINCWDTDGLWVGRILADLPEELRNEGECFSGVVFRHPTNGNVYAYSGPDCTYRISRVKVQGLDEIERFGGQVVVTQRAAPRPAKDEALRPWSILRARGRIAVDGVLDGVEWGTRTDTQAPVDFEHNGRQAARSWAQWDDGALYVGWNIKDRTPALNRSRGDSRWAGDQVELMLRAQPGAATKSQRYEHTATEYQLEVGPDGDGRLGVYVILNGSDRKGKFLPGAELALKIAGDKSGYTMELRIPWSSLGDYRPVKGHKILWNMKIHWGTPDGAAVAYASQWAPGLHTNPQTWGVAVLE